MSMPTLISGLAQLVVVIRKGFKHFLHYLLLYARVLLFEMLLLYARVLRTGAVFASSFDVIRKDFKNMCLLLCTRV